MRGSLASTLSRGPGLLLFYGVSQISRARQTQKRRLCVTEVLKHCYAFKPGFWFIPRGSGRLHLMRLRPIDFELLHAAPSVPTCAVAVCMDPLGKLSQANAPAALDVEERAKN